MKRFLLSAVALSAMTVSGIYAQAKEGEVQTRREDQQKRIGEGVQNGTLTPRETGKLENKEGKINHEIHNDRAANGGKLTAAEKKRVNRQQNKVSKDIYKQKHDAQNQ